MKKESRRTPGCVQPAAASQRHQQGDADLAATLLRVTETTLGTIATLVGLHGYTS
jgi:hypothetical protein